MKKKEEMDKNVCTSLANLFIYLFYTKDFFNFRAIINFEEEEGGSQYLSLFSFSLIKDLDDFVTVIM
jgi:hypothetical protein